MNENRKHEKLENNVFNKELVEEQEVLAETSTALKGKRLAEGDFLVFTQNGIGRDGIAGSIRYDRPKNRFYIDRSATGERKRWLDMTDLMEMLSHNEVVALTPDDMTAFKDMMLFAQDEAARREKARKETQRKVVPVAIGVGIAVLTTAAGIAGAVMMARNADKGRKKKSGWF